MKLRIKYAKLGALKYIGHLDVMRSFQKAIRRAGLQVAYTKGFSPHQIISFAAPMPLGMTSEGEYFDGEFEAAESSEAVVSALNRVLPPELAVFDCVQLSEQAKASMAIVTATDYVIYRHPESEADSVSRVLDRLDAFFSREHIPVIKKTKSGEKETDIRPLLYRMRRYREAVDGPVAEQDIPGEGIYLCVSSGSTDNLKPELVFEALLSEAGLPYDRFDIGIHRLETYTGTPDALVPLCKTGTRF